jgi:hypothetical protein
MFNNGRLVAASVLLILLGCATASEEMVERTPAVAVCEAGNGTMIVEITSFAEDGSYNTIIRDTDITSRDRIDQEGVPALMRHVRVNRTEDLVGNTFSGLYLIQSNGGLIYPIPKYLFLEFIADSFP